MVHHECQREDGDPCKDPFITYPIHELVGSSAAKRNRESTIYKTRVLPWLALVFATPLHLMLGCIVSQTLKHRSHPSIETCH